MKAKFIDKQDNEYIKVESVRLKGFDHDVKPEFLQFEDYTNWNALRNQAAIAAMQAQITDHEAMVNVHDALFNGGDTEASGLQKAVAEMSVRFADALVAELRNDT